MDQASPTDPTGDGLPDAIATVDQFGVDDHSNPSLTTTRDGRIVAVYADHANDRPRFGRLYYRISDRPFDVDSLRPVRSVPGAEKVRGGQGVAYPNPVTMRSGPDVPLLAGQQLWPNVSITSDFRLVEAANGHPRAPGQRPYATYAGTGNGAYVAYTNAHPNSRPTSLWCLLVREDGAVLRLDGRRVGSLARPPAHTRGTRVYRYSPRLGCAWIMDVASGSTRDNWRPVSPRGLTGDRTQVWWFAGDYRNYRAFSTKVMVDVGVSLGALGG